MPLSFWLLSGLFSILFSHTLTPLASLKNANLQFYSCHNCKSTATFGLGLNRFPCRTKKGPKVTAKPLNSLGDLAHTVDERFVLAYPADLPALVAPSWEETLINLDYLLSWCHPLLKTIRSAQSNDATSITRKSSESQMLGVASSQSGGAAEISLKPFSAPGLGQQNFSPSQSNASHNSQDLCFEFPTIYNKSVSVSITPYLPPTRLKPGPSSGTFETDSST
ncbi:hypothetical protein DSO57_1003330 [Entomophthora muscae]|uniref:Uncharacterized protein n=1 Tax=Entomophthora muscae TaxID=34485 RepID=A0ACC2U6W8_9FUNG|nr:hypothetical protein DSO57_1003330 [Entomophthora muscae]